MLANSSEVSLDKENLSSNEQKGETKQRNLLSFSLNVNVGFGGLFFDFEDSSGVFEGNPRQMTWQHCATYE